MTGANVLWLTPDKPDNISVGRRRLATHLEDAGNTVELRGTTPQTILQSIRERGKFDVVIGTTRAGAIAGIIISRIHGIPLVVDHIDPIRQFRETNGVLSAAIVKRLEHLAFRLADHVLYVYSEESSRIERRAVASTKTDLGVDFEWFADPSSEIVTAVRNRLEESQNKIAIYVGGLEPMYSIKPMLDSVKDLDDWTLLIVGTGSMQPEVEEAATNSNEIHFLGTVPHEEVPGYMHLADVGLSLVDDPYTLKVLEYGAAGLPVVQLAGRAESRFGGLVEYTTDDPANIALAIERADGSNLGPALQRYVSQFDWNKIAMEYCQVITTVK